MKLPRPVVPARCCLAGLAWAVMTGGAAAASGQIDSFGASATTVRVGGTVDFSVSFSIVPSNSTWGGSNPQEPAPQDGYQEWYVNWYGYDRETVTSVWLSGPGGSFAESSPGAPGSTYGGTWSFSMRFDQVGRHDLSVSGGYGLDVESYSSNEWATRSCWNNDPGGTDELFCDSWQWQYSDYDDRYGSDGSFAGVSLSIDVIPVPEPPSALLALVGIAALLGWRRR